LQASLSKNLKQAGASEAIADGISKSISTVTAAGIGASAGNVNGNGLKGAATAVNVDANNRQLHPTEIQWITQNAQRFAKQQGISEEEAEKRLSDQAYRQVQAGVATPEDSSARDFLKQAGRQMLPADPATPGLGLGYMFFTTPEQKNNPLMYVDSLIVYADFYRKNDIKIPSAQQIATAAAKDWQQRDRIAQLTVGATAVSGLVALAGTAPALAGWILANPDKAVQTGLITAETGAAIASGAITPGSVTEGLAIGAGRQLTAAERGALQEFNAVLRSVGQRKILAQQEQRLGELVQVFKPGSNIKELTLAGERVMLQNTNSAGTTKLFNTSGLSDAELQKRVFDYAAELSGNAPIEKVLKNGVALEGRWSVKLQDGATINIRSVSTSGAGRWTIDIQGNLKLGGIKPNYRDNQYEIKFK